MKRGFGKVIYAPNINAGGGAVLLLSLMESLQEYPNTLYILDERMKLPLNTNVPIHVLRIKHSFFSRLKAEIRLSNEIGDSGTVLCLGNLPPFFSVKADVVLFIQNRLLLDKNIQVNLSFFSRIRIMIQRIWLRIRNNSVKCIIVQTSTMRDLMIEFLGRRPDILPFFDTDRFQCSPGVESIIQRYDFIYVASSDPHKNHRNLILAWIEMAKQERYPSLCLTLSDTNDGELIRWIRGMKSKHELDIHLVGEVTHNEILEYYKISSALIYPSYVESFGLPLIEAASLGMPILAAKLDYVKDVVTPTMTFDPDSPTSIMNAVLSNNGDSAKLSVDLLSSEQFVSRVFR